MKNILKYMKEKYLVLDGATGTHLQINGLKNGVCPEQFVIENEDVLISLQKAYVDAGSDIILTCTFGANAKKLKTYGLDDRVYEMNKNLALISKSVGAKFVGGDIGSTGQFIEPLGDTTFEMAVDIFKEQIKGLVDGGVDLIAIETMLDVNEARAAIIASKEVCDLPVFVSMTFDAFGRTLTGTSSKAAAIILQAAGADAIGLNCSTGPKEMVQIVKDMKSVLDVPLIVKPNAGIPKLVDGVTVFDLGKEDFKNDMVALVKLGADIVGGCCGTDPEYIKTLSDSLLGLKPDEIVSKKRSILASGFEIKEVVDNGKLFVIGERINPTGKKALKEDFKQGKIQLAVEYSNEQTRAGADAIDVNVGVPGIDENELMQELIKTLGSRCRVPLCIDSSYPSVIEKALRIYPGRGIINSISLEEGKAEALLPIAKKYGAMFILLPIDEHGIPETGEKRIHIIEKLYRKAKSYGLNKEDILVDGLAFAISSTTNAGNETFKVIQWCIQHGFKTTLGVSNSSFGLPARKWINTSYLSTAMTFGLTSAIINPCEEILMNTALSTAAVLGRDKGYLRYINRVADVQLETLNTADIKDIYTAVLKGKDGLTLASQAAKSREITDIIENDIIKALNEVGERFASKRYFLPQLLASASSAKDILDYLEPLMKKSEDGIKKKEKFVIATVKGDIHDIGKNLVGLMLKNHGYDVVDLGKDVPRERIVKAIIKHHARIVGLSALMTTTAKEMEKAIIAINKECPDVKIMVGGAVITPDFAEQIGADIYANDAADCIKLANEYFSK